MAHSATTKGTIMRKALKALLPAALLAAGGLFAVSQAVPSDAGTQPAWLHVVHTNHRHNGYPCVIVYGGKGGSSALVCKDGYADAS
jgi:hypothetical protein